MSLAVKRLLRDPETVAHALAATDLYSFIEMFFPLVSGGRPLQHHWSIEAIAYHLERVAHGEITRLIITMPPRSLKSFCVSVALPAYLLGRDPTNKIIAASYSERLAVNLANDCRTIIKSERYRRVFRDTRLNRNKDTETEIRTTRGGFRLTTSHGGTVTGRGGDILIVDDPMKAEDAYSDATREGVNRWFRTTLMSRLDNKRYGAVIVVMQRLHPEDLVGELLAQGGWIHLNLAAIADTEQHVPLRAGQAHIRLPGDVLDPSREPLEVLEAIKQQIGSMTFAAQYQQAPAPIEGNIVKRAWLRFYDAPPVVSPYDRILVSWDTASSISQGADYSACVVLLVRGETVFVIDVIRRRLEYPDLKRAVLEQYRRWRKITGHCTLLIENADAGRSLLQDLDRDHVHAVKLKPDGDKRMRMIAQTAVIESGALRLPSRAPWLDEFLKELLSFPGSKNDDQVDALSQALLYARRPEPPSVLFGYYNIVA
jgi:predicted phage terminase large subunit-like protein